MMDISRNTSHNKLSHCDVQSWEHLNDYQILARRAGGTRERPSSEEWKSSRVKLAAVKWRMRAGGKKGTFSCFIHAPTVDPPVGVTEQVWPPTNILGDELEEPASGWICWARWVLGILPQESCDSSPAFEDGPQSRFYKIFASIFLRWSLESEVQMSWLIL